MEKNTTEMTYGYIDEHPYIKNCLKKGIINYSSLARLIAKELNIEKYSSKEAILIAARRKQKLLEKEHDKEKEISRLLTDSEIDIKNKIVVFIIDKENSIRDLNMMQSQIQKAAGLSYILEGSDNHTIITQERFTEMIKETTGNKLIKTYSNMIIRKNRT